MLAIVFLCLKGICAIYSTGGRKQAQTASSRPTLNNVLLYNKSDTETSIILLLFYYV